MDPDTDSIIVLLEGLRGKQVAFSYKGYVEYDGSIKYLDPIVTNRISGRIDMVAHWADGTPPSVILLLRHTHPTAIRCEAILKVD